MTGESARYMAEYQGYKRYGSTHVIALRNLFQDLPNRILAQFDIKN